MSGEHAHISLPLKTLFIRLSNAGFEINPEQYLSIQRLLIAQGSGLSAEELGVLICPLIARNELEQKLFHDIFEHYYKEDIELWLEKESTNKKNISKRSARTQDSLFNWKLISIFLLLGLVFWLTLPPTKPKATPQVESNCVFIDEPVKFSNFTQQKKDRSLGTLSYQWYVEDTIYKESSASHSFSNSSQGLQEVTLIITRQYLWHKMRDTASIEFIVQDEAPPENVEVIHEPSNPKLGDVIKFDVSLENGTNYYLWRIGDTTVESRSFTYAAKNIGSIPINLAISKTPLSLSTQNKCYTLVRDEIFIRGQTTIIPLDEKTPINANQIQVIHSWKPWIKWIWLGILLVIGVLLQIWRRYLHSKWEKKLFEDELKSGDQPPYSIQFASQASSLKPEEEIYTLASILRQRRKGHIQELLIESSIQATIQAGGFPTLIHQTGSVAAEYLVLIERKGEHDHQARLFDTLVRILHEEMVNIDVFFFENDPRFCYKEVNKTQEIQAFHIDRLFQLYGQHRLLIFARPEVILHETKADITNWAKQLLLKWQERVWFSPQPYVNWGYGEQIVQRNFVVLSSDLSAQIQLVELLESNTKDGIHHFSFHNDLPETKHLDLHSIVGLREYLTPIQLQWLASTMVYEKQSWELTLAIGQSLSEITLLNNTWSDLQLDYQTLQKISVIPCLRDGEVGEELREELLALLDPEIETVARKKILQLLKATNIPPESFAWEELQVEILTQEVKLNPEDRQDQHATKKYNSLVEAGRIVDNASAREINKKWQQQLVTFLIIGLLGIGGTFIFNIDLKDSSLAYVPISSKLTDPIFKDSAAFYNNEGVTHFIQDSIHLANQSFLKALTFDPDFETTIRNLGILKYNQAVGSYQEGSYRKALNAFNMLQDIDILSQDVLHGSGLCYYYLDIYDSALNAFNRILEMEPEYFTFISPNLKQLLENPVQEAPQPITSPALEENQEEFSSDPLEAIRDSVLIANQKTNNRDEVDSILESQPPSLPNISSKDSAIDKLGIITIPVVVHVVYNKEEQNISKEQILSQIQVLNEDYRRKNPDRFETPEMFKAVAADCKIEFKLANTDPNGNPTEGVTRTSTDVAGFSAFDNEMKFSSKGGIDAWPATDYLNLWVCHLSMGVLGYAQYPGGPAKTDGVVISYKFFGRGELFKFNPPFHLGRTTTHEVAHWLNLRHIWGDGPCGTDDFVADTPMSEGPVHGCLKERTTCGTPDMVSNFMDFLNDACMNMFSQGQALRMRANFKPGGARHSILYSKGLETP